MTTVYEKAAHREQVAEVKYGKAKEEYWRFWWNSTLLLGEPEEGSDELKKAFGDMQEVLHQSRGHLRKRRNLALSINKTVVNSGDIYTLTPTLCLVWIEEDQGEINREAAAKLRQFQEAKIGFRRMVTELGGTNRPSKQTAEERHSAAATPEQVINAIRQSAYTRRAIVQDRQASDALSDERAQATAESVRNRYGFDPPPEKQNPDDRQFQRERNIDDNLVDARHRLRGAVRSLREFSPDAGQIQRWSGIARDVISLANAVVDELNGMTEFNDELSLLLQSEDQR